MSINGSWNSQRLGVSLPTLTVARGSGHFTSFRPVFVGVLEIDPTAMSNPKPQAITGVSAGAEAPLMTKWPSIAALWWGRKFGQWLEMSPTRVMGVKLSNLLFGLPLAGPAALLYLVQKVTGERFTITNRSVQRWSGLGGRMIQRVELGDIASMQVAQQPGQEFYHASDLLLLNSNGDVVMRLEGLPHAEIFRENITKTRDAAMQVQASLNTIRARQSA
jgi:hypothetical protein